MSMRENVLFALTGWVAGLLITLGVGMILFPAVEGITHSLRTGPDPILFAFVVLLVSPTTLLGGLIGGRMPKEGGPGGQYLMAAILGIVASLPFSCLSFWYTGW